MKQVLELYQKTYIHQSCFRHQRLKAEYKSSFNKTDKTMQFQQAEEPIYLFILIQYIS